MHHLQTYSSFVSGPIFLPNQFSILEHQRVTDYASQMDRSHKGLEDINLYPARAVATQQAAASHKPTLSAAQYPRASRALPEPLDPYEPFCFQPAPNSSFMPQMPRVPPAPKEYTSYAYSQLPISDALLPLEGHLNLPGLHAHNRKDIPRSLIPGLEPRLQLEAYYPQVAGTPPVKQPLRRSARNKPSAPKGDGKENPAAQINPPNTKLSSALEPDKGAWDRIKKLEAKQARLRLELEQTRSEAEEAIRRQNHQGQQPTADLGKVLSQAWQSAREKGEEMDPTQMANKIARSNQRVRLWVENVVDDHLAVPGL